MNLISSGPRASVEAEGHVNAIKDLQAYLEDGEHVEAIVFGPWSGPEDEGPAPVPTGKVLTLEEAEPYMEGWSFYGGFGSPECYAVYVWTSRRVIWVTQFDGSTGLYSAPRNPTAVIPDMPGG